VPLGIYRGLRFGVVLHPHFPPDVYLEGAATRQSMLSREHQGARAVLNALERLADDYGSECDRVRQELRIAQSQLRDHKARLGKPFFYEAYLTDLTDLRDQLKLALSGRNPDQGPEPQANASDFATQIKALKAAHRIEPGPGRAGTRSTSLEKPIATRIRRQLATLSTSDPAS
jgi:hypothetical protein